MHNTSWMQTANRQVALQHPLKNYGGFSANAQQPAQSLLLGLQAGKIQGFRSGDSIKFGASSSVDGNGSQFAYNPNLDKLIQTMAPIFKEADEIAKTAPKKEKAVDEGITSEHFTLAALHHALKVWLPPSEAIKLDEKERTAAVSAFVFILPIFMESKDGQKQAHVIDLKSLEVTDIVPYGNLKELMLMATHALEMDLYGKSSVKIDNPSASSPRSKAFKSNQGLWARFTQWVKRIFAPITQFFSRLFGSQSEALYPPASKAQTGKNVATDSTIALSPKLLTLLTSFADTHNVFQDSPEQTALKLRRYLLANEDTALTRTLATWTEWGMAAIKDFLTKNRIADWVPVDEGRPSSLDPLIENLESQLGRLNMPTNSRIREFSTLQTIAQVSAKGEHQKFTDRYKALKASGVLTEAQQRAIEGFLGQFSRMTFGQMDYGMASQRLDIILNRLKYEPSKTPIDIQDFKSNLDRLVIGQDVAKERFYNYVSSLELRRLAKENGTAVPDKPKVVCLMGPPGIGKTTLAGAFAKAMGRPFASIALGGEDDPANIKGFKYGYVGANPGKIVQGLYDIAPDSVVLLDEIDKIRGSYRGNPADVLLKVLDAKQNNSFEDDFLQMPLDLSKVTFIATANDEEQLLALSDKLHNRMEIIRMDGYTPKERKQIAYQSTIPAGLLQNGLLPEWFAIPKTPGSSELRPVNPNEPKDVELLARTMFPEPVMDAIISGHTREQGIRNLEDAIERMLEWRTTQPLTKTPGAIAHQDYVFTTDNLERVLGKGFKPQTVLDKGRVGHIIGLAYSERGGSIQKFSMSAGVPYSNTMTPDRAQIIITNPESMGKMMTDSFEAARSYVTSQMGLKDLGLAEKLKGKTVEVNVQGSSVAGGIDGPSASVAATLLLHSVLTDQVINPHVAVTGEISNQGDARAIGGLSQKIPAGVAAGAKYFIIPAQNTKGDLKSIAFGPQNAKKTVKVVTDPAQLHDHKDLPVKFDPDIVAKIKKGEVVIIAIDHVKEALPFVYEKGSNLWAQLSQAIASGSK